MLLYYLTTQGSFLPSERVQEYSSTHSNLHFIIHYDSEYAHSAVTTNALPASNTALIFTIRDILRRARFITEVSFHKVQAHSGNYWNDVADQLAKFGLNVSPVKGKSAFNHNLQQEHSHAISETLSSNPLTGLIFALNINQSPRFLLQQIVPYR